MSNLAMELAHDTEVGAEQSPLATARVHRQLTLEEAARRAGISADEARWLEEARVYRFRSPDDALLAALLYATALGIDRREALELAGRPAPPRPASLSLWPRVAVLGTIAFVVAAAVLAAVYLPGRGNGGAALRRPQPTLPPPWAIRVDVFNGAGDINHTRQLASRIGAIGYRIGHVGPARRFDQRETVVYYEPGGLALGERLARQICAPLEPLPHGSNTRRLVVVVGPATVETCRSSS
jgi:transcriptional regulator with XRE-family HTH domain